MTVEQKKAQYEIIKKAAYTDYVLLDRKVDYCTYVVAYAFNEETYSWGQGHYFNDKNEALHFFYTKEAEKLQAEIEDLEEMYEL